MYNYHQEEDEKRQSLYGIMSCMRDIRKRTDRTDSMFDPLKETVALLQNYGITTQEKVRGIWSQVWEKRYYVRLLYSYILLVCNLQLQFCLNMDCIEIMHSKLTCSINFINISRHLLVIKGSNSKLIVNAFAFYAMQSAYIHMLGTSILV